MNHSLFVAYETAVLAKEVGFLQHTGVGIGAYEKLEDGTVWLHTGGAWPIGLLVAPTYQQLIDWFREKHGLNIIVYCNYGWRCKIEKGEKQPEILFIDDNKSSYYQALMACINGAFKLIAKK